jgi:(+)-pinoresinol hydroxylase
MQALAKAMTRNIAVLVLIGNAGVAFSAAPTGRIAGPAPLVSGELVYQRWCVHCHAAGRGYPGTESLQVKYGGKLPAVLLDRKDLTPQAVGVFVRQGILSMPPFRKTEITDVELAALADYVAKASKKKPRA